MRRYILSAIVLFMIVALQPKAEAQVFKTKLRVTVVDKLGNVVPDAKVIIFKTKEDYDKEVNPAKPFQLTDNKGRVTFKGLQAIAYYIIVRKGDLDNFGGGVVINALEEGKMNKSNIVITDGL